MLKKKLLILNTTIVLGLSSLLATTGVSAESVSDMENKKKQIQNQRSGLKSDINSTDEKIKKLQEDQDAIAAEIKRIDLAVEDTNTKIREKNVEITDTNAEIEKLEKEITILKERIEKRNAILKDRALSFQENGGKVNYLEVLLGASSFGDLLDRVSAVSTIMEADEDLVKQHEQDKKDLETTQKKVENKLAKLKSLREELEKMKATLSKQKATKDTLMKKLAKEEEAAHSHKMSLQEEDDILASQQAAINKAIANEKKRQAALEEARKQALNNSSSGGSGSGQAPAISSGNFTKPAVGRLTSGFGSRWGSTHYGVDIANSADVPIVAAADGVVVRSYYSPSYGNAVFIAHSIGGQVYTTVYAHMDSRMVSDGATVSKGQQIGIMGNTGQSFGQHLHFELHRGSWNASKSGAINPIGIVPL